MPACDECPSTRLVYQDRLWSVYLCEAHYDAIKRDDGTIPMARAKKAETTTALASPVVTLDMTAAQAAAAAVLAEAESILAYVKSVPITTAELEQWAADTDGTIAAKAKAADADKKAKLGPIRDLLDLVTAWWTKPAKIYTEARAILKAGIATSVETRRALAAAAYVEAASVPEMQAAIAATAAVPDGMHERKTYRAVVVDPALVPAMFWRIDQAALDALAAEQKEAFAVPGCQLACDTSLSRNAR